MPYRAIDDLPDSVKHSLPKHGQEIYKSAFNNALDEYGSNDSKKRQNSSDDPEEVAHKVAWSAVKRKYVKVREGIWKAKD